MSQKCKKNSDGFPCYKLVKFGEYQIINKNNKKILVPNVKSGMIPKIVDDVSGLELLLSLVNLYNRYNSKLYNNNQIGTLDNGIIDWCNNNYQPCHFESIILATKILEDKNEKPNKDYYLELISKGYFDLNDFFTSVLKLANAFNSWYAIDKIYAKKDIGFIKRDIEFGNIYMGNMLMHSTLFKDAKTKNDIVKIVKKEGWRLLGLLLTELPSFQSVLDYDKKEDKFDILLKANTIFDIAWFTLATLIKDSYKNKNYNHKVLVCENCGDYIIRSSSTQKYCDKEECQAARNRAKVNRFNKKSSHK